MKNLGFLMLGIASFWYGVYLLRNAEALSRAYGEKLKERPSPIPWWTSQSSRDFARYSPYMCGPLFIFVGLFFGILAIGADEQDSFRSQLSAYLMIAWSLSLVGCLVGYVVYDILTNRKK